MQLFQYKRPAYQQSLVLCLTVLCLLQTLTVLPVSEAELSKTGPGGGGEAVESRVEDDNQLIGAGNIRFEKIPPGEFIMGSDGFARPKHKVRITKPFYISAHEVTIAQYSKTSGAEELDSRIANLPKNTIHFSEAEKFAKNYQLEGMSCRLPTEAEWEYACAYSVDVDTEKSIAWFNRATTSPEEVGQLAGNPFGLYDMLGNVWEWVLDDAVKYTPEGETSVDPLHRKTGGKPTTWGVIRGGAYHSSQRRVKCQTRQAVDRRFASASFIGFRIVCEAGEV